MAEDQGNRRRSRFVWVGIAFVAVAIVARLLAELTPSNHLEWIDGFGSLFGSRADWLGFQVLLWLVPLLATSCAVVLALRERNERRSRRDA